MLNSENAKLPRIPLLNACNQLSIYSKLIQYVCVNYLLLILCLIAMSTTLSIGFTYASTAPRLEDGEETDEVPPEEWMAEGTV